MEMFKKAKIYILLFVLSVSSISCLDDLDKAPDGNIQMDEVLKDPFLVEGLLNGCYNNIPNKGYNYHWFDELPVTLSDDAYTCDDMFGTPICGLIQDNASADHHPLRDDAGGSNQHYWPKFWEQIRLCNQFIELIDKAAVQNEENRGRFRAEARVLRCFFYMELIKWFGGMPIIESPMGLEADFSTLKRASVYENAKFMCQDLDKAIAEPNLPWRIEDPADGMRMTKAIALAIKTKVMLFAASPLHNQGVNHWEEAYTIAKESVKLLKEHGYALYTKVSEPSRYTGKGAALHELVTRNADYSSTPRDAETIMQVRDGGNFTWHIAYLGNGLPALYKCTHSPSQELVDAFETIDGVPVLDLKKPYLDEKHLEPNYNKDNTLYDPKNPYSNRDPRLYHTALYNGAVVSFNDKPLTIETFVGGNMEPSLSVGVANKSRTGYYNTKFVVAGCGGNYQQNTSNWKYYRLGETLLDLAEAAAEAGHAEEALAAANEVRHRSGMPDLPANLTQEELVLRVHNERRVELAFEENRYFDLRRWQKPTGDLSETCRWFSRMEIIKNADGSFTYSRKPLNTKARGCSSNRDLLLPIDLQEATLLEQITGEKWQNPGW